MGYTGPPRILNGFRAKLEHPAGVSRVRRVALGSPVARPRSGRRLASSTADAAMKATGRRTSASNTLRVKGLGPCCPVVPFFQLFLSKGSSSFQLSQQKKVPLFFPWRLGICEGLVAGSLFSTIASFQKTESRFQPGFPRSFLEGRIPGKKGAGNSRSAANRRSARVGDEWLMNMAQCSLNNGWW